MSTRLAFDLPPALEASEPPEAHGVARDDVRMMVASRSTNELVHTTFAALPGFLGAGDLVVINTSATIPAALDALAADGRCLALHLSTQVDDGLWVVEPRRKAGGGTERWEPTEDGPVPTLLAVGEGASIELLEPYRGDRLWLARIDVPVALPDWLAANGRPIRYSYLSRAWPLDAYQNVYARHWGSAEMPSAGRPFTPEVITHLVAEGVGIAPIVLHTGVASLESDEMPYPERVVVPKATADRVNLARATGGRVIAIGTTVVRALESAADAADADGVVGELDGWTDLVVTPEGGVRVVDGLLTGWHEPEASHLLMLEAIAGRDLLERSYGASIEHGYLWHEFGDVELILP